MPEMSAPAQPGPTASYFGVRTMWAFAVLVPTLVVVWVTETLFWGLVVILATDLLVAAVTAVRGTVPWRDRYWFGVPAVATWVLVAFLVSRGSPSDDALYSRWPLALFALLLGLDALVRVIRSRTARGKVRA